MYKFKRPSFKRFVVQALIYILYLVVDMHAHVKNASMEFGYGREKLTIDEGYALLANLQQHEEVDEPKTGNDNDNEI